MAITDIVRQKRIYFFTGYLADVVLENIVIGFRCPFPTLTPAKISTDKNIIPRLINLLSFNFISIARSKYLNMPSIATCNVVR